jgi:excisionase family DNA binding protein
MSTRIALPLPDGRWLALTAEQLEEALRLGAETIGGPARPGEALSGAEPLLDAAELAKALRVPQTWLEQATREKKIPCLRFGRWIRYRRAEVESAISQIRSP